MSIRNRISRQEPLSVKQTQQLTSLSSMEPFFAPKATTPQSSKTVLVIGGLRVYVYGLEEAQKQGYSDVAVLYLAHGRTRHYGDMELIAHEILHQYGNAEGRRSAGLIAVAVDMRNHGERKLSEKSNDAWDQGNEFHAQDMLSVISGSAQDFDLLIDYLPTYLTQFNKFYNIMSGMSLGGHTSWRLGTNSSSKLHGLAIMIGCPNLAALLLNRLGVDSNALSSLADDLYKTPYDTLSELLTDEQRRRWPRALHDLVAELDRNTAEKFPKDVPTYILNGKLDPLVPDRFTEAWVAKRKAEGYSNLDHFAQDNTGHTVTQAMVDKITGWLVKLFT